MTMPLGEDQATAIGNMYKRFGEDCMCTARGMLTDKHTDTLITILRSPIGGGATKLRQAHTDSVIKRERTIII